MATGLDLRDNHVSPNVGVLAEAKAELAGLVGLGDVKHFMHEYEAQGECGESALPNDKEKYQEGRR